MVFNAGNMDINIKHPAVILAGLGAISGVLGTMALDVGYGQAPSLGIYMVLTGLWFGLVIGFGVWRWGDQSLAAAGAAVIATWIAWELAVNLAVQIEEHWSAMTAMPGSLKSYVSGFAGGTLGAFVTWAGAAAFTPALRKTSTLASIVIAGALFGLLLPLTSHYDYPVALLLPWQAAIAATLGMALTYPQDRRYRDAD